jgi:hypothetical protein
MSQDDAPNIMQVSSVTITFPLSMPDQTGRFAAANQTFPQKLMK